MGLSSVQLVTLKTAIFAETDPLIMAARSPATRDDRVIAAWYSDYVSPTAYAWSVAALQSDVDEATNWTAFDTLSAGKRDSWGHFFSYSRNFTKAAVRKWVTDIWGNATAGSDAEKILQAGREKLRRIENVLGGTTKTTDNVSALDRNYVGTLSLDDASAALNMP